MMTHHNARRFYIYPCTVFVVYALVSLSLLQSASANQTQKQNNNIEQQQEQIDPMQYIDRDLYVGMSSTFILSDTNRNATMFVLSAEIHWGIALTLSDSFEGGIYRYAFKENRVSREDRNNQEPGRENYIHTGLRASWIHYTHNEISRLFPVYEDSAKFLPFWTLGFALEPSLEINDRKQKAYDGDVYWSIGLTQGVGYLHILPRTHWRLRYELGLLETYTPTVNFHFFFEPFLRIKLEYAFSVRQVYKPVDVVVISNPPLYAKDGKSIDELIAAEEGVVTNFQFEEVIKRHNIATSNVDVIQGYNIQFKKQSQYLSLNGIVELNKVAFDRRNEKRDGKNQAYVVRAYAVFLDDYMDLRPDLPRNERREYITKRLMKLAYLRATLIESFLLDKGVPKENIGIRWTVVPESELKDGVIISSYVANPDLIITRDEKSGDTSNISKNAQSFRDVYTTVGDIRFDLRKQEKGGVRDVLEGNSIALERDDSALAVDTEVVDETIKEDEQAVATTDAATDSTTLDATEQLAINASGNLYEHYSISLENPDLLTQQAAFPDYIVVEPVSLLIEEEEADGVDASVEFAISQQLLDAQKERAIARDRVFVLYQEQELEWAQVSIPLLQRLFGSRKKNTEMRSIELRSYYSNIERPIDLTIINKARATKLQQYIRSQAGIHPSIVRISTDANRTFADTTNIPSPEDYTLAIEIIIR